MVLRIAATAAAAPEAPFVDGVAVAFLAAIPHVGDVPLAIAIELAAHQHIRRSFHPALGCLLSGHDRAGHRRLSHRRATSGRMCRGLAQPELQPCSGLGADHYGRDDAPAGHGEAAAPAICLRELGLTPLIQS
jgi:hypothetical protein